MKTLFTVLVLVPGVALAGGYCQPRYQQKYYAPAYKAPVYHQPQITLIGIPVPYVYHAPVAKQGHTQYGYSLSSYVNKPLDLTLAFTQAARLTQEAQKLSGDSLAGVQAIIETEGGRQSRVAEIDAKARLLRAAEPSGETESSRLEVSSGKVQVEDDIGGEVATSDTGDAVDVIEAKCLSCHSGASPKGGLNLSKYAAFSAEKQAKVLGRITTADAAKRMPPEGSLSVDELKAFFAD